MRRERTSVRIGLRASPGRPAPPGARAGRAVVGAAWPARGSCARRYAERHAASRHSTALWPPKPNEFDSASAGRSPPWPPARRSGRCHPRPAAAPRRARSRGRGPRRARTRPSVGGAIRSRSASRWRPPRPRRRRRAGARSRTWSRTPGFARALAERELDRVRLGAVVERRRGAVRVDVVDRARADAGVGERGAHGGGLARPVVAGAVRWWASALAP